MYVYIAPGQGQKPPRDKLLMSTESPYHFDHLLQVSKDLFEFWFYTYFFNVFPRIWPWGRGRQPFVDKILMSTEKPCHYAHLLQVSKNIFEVWFYTLFFMFLYMYIAPGQKPTTPSMGSEFLFYHKSFVTLVICCKFLPLNDFLTVFPPYKSIRDQIWPCCKIGQGQPRVIIWIKYDWPRVPNATYQATMSLAFWFWRRKYLKGFLPYMARGGHLGHVTQTPQTKFHSPIPLRLHMKFGFDLPSGFGRRSLKMVEDGWRTMAIL